MIKYDRNVLVEILVYHWQTNTSGCGCGWAELGKSHPEHVADVYEEMAKDNHHLNTNNQYKVGFMDNDLRWHVHIIAEWTDDSGRRNKKTIDTSMCETCNLAKEDND